MGLYLVTNQPPYMKPVINGLISLALIALGMVATLLVFYVLAWAFGDLGWYLPQAGRVVSGVIGFIFGLYLCIAYNELDT